MFSRHYSDRYFSLIGGEISKFPRLRRIHFSTTSWILELAKRYPRGSQEVESISKVARLDEISSLRRILHPCMQVCHKSTQGP